MKFKINNNNCLNESMDASDAFHVWQKKFDRCNDIFYDGRNKLRTLLLSYKEVNVTDLGFEIMADGIKWKLKIDTDVSDPLFKKISKQLESIKNNQIYGGYGYRCELDLNGNLSYLFSGFANFGSVNN